MNAALQSKSLGHREVGGGAVRANTQLAASRIPDDDGLHPSLRGVYRRAGR